jgi:hypothetical protein
MGQPRPLTEEEIQAKLDNDMKPENLKEEYY